MEHYVETNGKRLRYGYTTGSCAAAAAKAAAVMLFSGEIPQQVSLETPKGIRLLLDVVSPELGRTYARCGIQKDGGDDPDVTTGAVIFATVQRSKQSKIVIEGGTGVGTVTRKGLDQPVGSAAINSVPRKMIQKEVEKILSEAGDCPGLHIVISVPNGEQIAQKTMNPRLGILGGISILGTSGIVEPMSEKALIDTIKAEMKMLSAAGNQYLLATPGNYGAYFVKEQLGLELDLAVRCSNFIGETLDYARYLGLKGILLVGHWGKLIKLAAGVMNTHSRVADGRMEILAAHAALAGADRRCIGQLMDCLTTDEAYELLQKERIAEAVLDTVMQKIFKKLTIRAGSDLEVGAILFSNQYGLLGKTEHAETLIQKIILGKEESK